MVAKAFMTLEELQKYRTYLVENENQLQDQMAAFEDVPTEMMVKIEWYRAEIEDADYWIEYRTTKKIEAEEEAAAQAWLHPKGSTRHTWRDRLYDWWHAIG